MVRVKKASAIIRKAEGHGDWQAVRTLCCRTGNNGEPIAKERWPFFAEQWVGPYQKLLPEWTSVADLGGVVVGYLTGCPNTQRFEREKFFKIVAPLLWSIFRKKYEMNIDTRRFCRRALRLESGPEASFPEDFLEKLNQDYPAHLHINVDSACRGLGVGSQLIEFFFEDLLKAGVHGAHVFCGADPVKFYKSIGFRELEAIDFRPKSTDKKIAAMAPVRVYALGMTF